VVANIDWDSSSAHSARYDAERTADLFCTIANQSRESYLRAEERARLLGWIEADTPPPAAEE
jgi:hypothetical protein